MKKKIIEHFGESVVITELNGKHNVVTFKSTAHSILHSFYKRNNKNDSECEKKAMGVNYRRTRMWDLNFNDNSVFTGKPC